MLKQKSILWLFCWKDGLCWKKTLRLGKTRLAKVEKGGRRMRMAGTAHCLNGHELGQTLEMVTDREAWCTTLMSAKMMAGWQLNNSGVVSYLTSQGA